MTGLSFEYILRHDNRAPHRSKKSRERRAERIDCIRWASGYAEGEGGDTVRAVLLGNWNDFSGDAVTLLERAGYGIEWDDEWDTCYNCAKAFRVSPDSYGWQPTYIEFPDGERYCRECADFEGYLESLEDNPRRCCFAHAVNPAEFGYVLVTAPGEFESGLHPGQNDNPADILKDLHAQGIRRIIFRTSSTGQFDVNFEAWRKDDTETDA